MAETRRVRVSEQDGAQVLAGVADVFLLDGGDRLPLVTLAAGSSVPPIGDGVVVEVVARLDGVIHRSEGAGTDRSVTAFSRALARLCGEAPADPVQLAATLQSYARAQRESRQQREWDRRAGDDREREEQFTLTTQAVEYLAGTGDSRSESALVRAITSVARAERIPLRPRRGGERTAASRDLVEGASEDMGLRARRVWLRETGWFDSRAHAFVVVSEREGPLALLPNNRGYVVQNASGQRRRWSHQDRDEVEWGYQLSGTLEPSRAVSLREALAQGAARSGRGVVWAALLSLAVAILSLANPFLLERVLSIAVPQAETGVIIQAGVALAIVALCSGALTAVTILVLSRSAQLFAEATQPLVWDRLLRLPPSFFRRYASGDVAVRVMAADAMLQMFSPQLIAGALASCFTVVNLVVLFVYSPLLGTVAVALLVATAVALAFAWRRLRSTARVAVAAQLTATQWITQTLAGLSKIRLAGAERRAHKHYFGAVRAQVAAQAGMTRSVGRVSAWVTALIPLGPGLFVMVILASAQSGSTTIIAASEFIAFTAAYNALVGGLLAAVGLLVPMAVIGPIVEMIRPILDTAPQEQAAPTRPHLSGAVALDRVSLRYEPSAPLAVDDVSVDIDAGEFVAVVGESGSGKSSIVRVLLGFEQPASGHVRFDGADLRDLDADAVREQMGVVIQDGRLSRGTVLENILGSAHGSVDDAWRAAEQAGVADDIRDMPMRMRTLVEPDLISGGQEQRILLARALVRRPAIVILDEATSALDNTAQAHVMESLERLQATRIVVAHRLSTVRRADRILVMKDGRMVESGSFDELMRRGEDFARLAQRQLV
ncbi:hypothetical protein GCM10009808_03980 [Microbacterium sediminicola]|uniref:NHLP bacteriocin export ABC transporter permease/ATPase subunit n=1 Tax=Microbacterium sediminicola TaxID=415210 RepID=A0ABN2HMB1_9MICO